MAPLPPAPRFHPRHALPLIAASLVLAVVGCTMGVKENTRTLTATGPDGGWTVLTFQSSESRLPAIEVNMTTEPAPTATAKLTFLDPVEGSLAASEAALQGASLSFGEPVVTPGADTTLPLTLSMPAAAEELPSIRTFGLTVPYALGVAIDVKDTSVHVFGLEGPVSVSTTNSGVGVSKPTGDVTVSTTNGSVNGVVGGGTVTTTQGDVKLDWAVVGALDVRTSNGKVTITVPADAGVSATLHAVNGTVTAFGKTYATDYQGPVGGKFLFVTTENDDIVLQ